MCSQGGLEALEVVMEDRPHWCSRVLETGNGKANLQVPPEVCSE